MTQIRPTQVQTPGDATEYLNGTGAFTVPGGGGGSSDWISVTDHGAVGDGTTDDTTAVQAAFDAVPAAGGVVYFPVGKYKVTGITISYPTRVVGAGAGDQYGGVGWSAAASGSYDATASPSVVVCTGSTGTAFTVNASGTSFADLAIVNTSGAVPTAGAGIRFTKGDLARLTRCRFGGFYNNVSFEQFEYAVIETCMFEDSVNYGLYVRNTVTADQGDMAVIGCSFSHSGAHSRVQGSAIRWESGGGLRVQDSKINARVGQYDYGVDLAHSSGATGVLVITGSSIENLAVNGVLVALTSTATFRNVVIVGNEFADCGDVAVKMSCTTAGALAKIAIGENVMMKGSSSSAYAIDLTNLATVTVGPNVVAGYAGELTQSGCTGVTMIGESTYGNDVLTATGGEDTVTFDSTLLAKSPILWKNGALLVPGTDYTLVDNVASLTTALSASDKITTHWVASSPAPSAPALSVATVVTDTFTRADSSTSIGTADTGQAWSALKGTWGIKTNAAELYTGAAGGQEVAVVDAGTGHANGTVQVDIIPHAGVGGGGIDAGVVTKVADASNYLLVAVHKLDTSSDLKLYKCVAGAFTQLGATYTGTSFAYGTTVTVKIVNTATTVDVYLDGNATPAISYTLTSGEQTTFNSNTKHGIRVNSTGDGTQGAAFDNFTVA